MSSFLVITLKDAADVGDLAAHVRSWQSRQLISIADAAVVIHRQDGTVKVRQANELVGVGALGGAFWGMMVSQCLCSRWLAPGRSLPADPCSDSGIARPFFEEVAKTVTLGRASLFMLVEQVAEEVLVGLEVQLNAIVLQTKVSLADEAKMRQAFGVLE